MDDHDRLCLLAQRMRHHEHLAALSPRGSLKRMNHEEHATQYRDEILGNARHPHNVRTRVVGQEKK